MTPKEKASQLIDKYRTFVVMWTGGVAVENENVKQCALICVDEIITQLQEIVKTDSCVFTNEKGDRLYAYDVSEFWEEVKKEITNQ